MKKNNYNINAFSCFYLWKIGWLRTVDTLHLLSAGLFNANKIALEAAPFVAHFIVGTNINERINWRGTYAELNYFITQLMKRGFIPFRHDEHVLIWEHFTLNGREIKRTCSHSSKSRGLNFESQRTIDLIIDRMDSLQ